jgi:very-short-patch-repair endonuclease
MGAKFRRQHAIDRYVADFYCPKVGLVVELDGPIHDSQAVADAQRQAYIESLGLRVLRFTNNDVLHNLPKVLETIRQATEAAT